MPIVPASKAESDDLVYGTIRPSPQDRDTDKIKKQLQDIESDRQRKRNSSQKAPPHEEGFSSPVFDDEHGCWKIQSSTESKILKIWDEKREIWRERYDKSIPNDASGVARAETWFGTLSRRATAWLGLKKGK